MNDNSYEFTIGLKIKENEVSAKTLMYLKKETKLGLNELKNKIAKGDYIFLYEASNDKGLWKINSAKRELSKQGATVQLFLNDREEESVFFDNLEKRNREISAEVGLTDEDIDDLYWDV